MTQYMGIERSTFLIDSGNMPRPGARSASPTTRGGAGGGEALGERGDVPIGAIEYRSRLAVVTWRNQIP